MEKLQNSQKQIFSVSEFIDLTNQNLEYSYSNIEIEGEVNSFKVNKNKFVFFDIKDEAGSLNCFMTIWQLRFPIEDGMKVIVSATPKITPWGKFSLVVSGLRPSGEGALKKSFDLLKAKLEKEGLFNPDRKRSIKEIPKSIAVISSTQAAGYADFIKILGERWGGLDISVFDVQVQGSGAADQIIEAINYFNQLEFLPDLIAIVRGGGSADDLSTFNDEILIRAISGSRVPILIGVGHETDETLADLAADIRASTPSNAAQMVTPDKNEYLRINNIKIGVLYDKLSQSINQYKLNNIQILKDALLKIENRLFLQENTIRGFKNIISQLDPAKILSRGYAIIYGKIKTGELVKLETSKYIIKAEVKDVREK